MRRVLMNLTSVRPQVGQCTPFGQRKSATRLARHVGISEVLDRFDESLGFVFHEPNIGSIGY